MRCDPTTSTAGLLLNQLQCPESPTSAVGRLSALNVMIAPATRTVVGMVQYRAADLF